jgi:hypothetical protein
MFNWFRKKTPEPGDDLDTKRALEFFARGDYGEALRRVEVMLAAGPDVALSWRFQGECLFHLNRYLTAADSFRRAGELGGPGTEDLFLWEALSLHNAGMTEPAKQVIRDFLASGRGTPELVAKAQGALAKLGS